MVAYFDSNSDHIQIFGSVIGHLGAEINFFFFFFTGISENLRGCQEFGHPYEFWHVGPVKPDGTVLERRRP
jgi:hypothetical protein